jgi:hypothetical protein
MRFNLFRGDDLMDKPNYKVYAHINKLNGKMYIGITSKSLKTRWRNGHGYNGYFGKAIVKYGWNNFDHEVIALNLTEKEAKNFEIMLIEKLQTTNPRYGYNTSMGGDLLRTGCFHTEETKRKLSQIKKGKYCGENSPTWGMKRPDLSKRNLESCKAVLQYTLSGEFVKRHNSIRGAAKEINRSKNGIAQACYGRYKQAYGYIWKFESEEVA